MRNIEVLVAAAAVFLCAVHITNSKVLGRPGDEEFSKTTGCPGPCNCTSYTATCSSLDFDRDELPPQVSGLKLIAPLQPLVLKASVFANLGMESLVSLIISGATITELDQTAFDGLPSLRTVSILNSIMPPIDARTFATSTKLKTLDLSGTALPTFNPIVSHTLEELILENCKLNLVTDDMFQRLPSLRLINLARNNIEKIDVNAFAEQEELEELILHHNKLQSMSFELFSKNVFIAALDLSHNPISKIEFNDDLELEKLTMNSCELTEFTNGPSTLVYLDVRNNKIKSFNVGNMIELQYLYLAHNMIEEITEYTFENNSALLTLILDNNPIGKLTPFINLKDEMFMLTNLSCRNCGIEKLDPHTFESLHALNSLDLSNNKIVNLEENVFSPLSRLVVLKLAKNKIKNVHVKAFSENTLLRKLDLSENEIVSLDVDAFEHNNKLELLDLSYGQIEKLWRTPTDLKLKIVAINAASNPLKNLTLEELRITPHLEVLDIDNVLVPCMQIIELLPYLKKNNIGPTIIKTHEDTIDASLDDYDDNHYKSWDEYSKSKGCDTLEYHAEDLLPISEQDDDFTDEDDEFDAYNNDDEIAENPWSDDTNQITIDDEEDSAEDPDDIADLDYDMSLVRSIEQERFATSTYNRFAYLWPTLVFLFTCLLVLMVAVNVILLVLRKRGALSRNVPQLKTSWGNSNRLLTKRHCGSIYRPLTEDLSGSKTPIISRSLLFTLPNTAGNDHPSVHNV